MLEAANHLAGLNLLMSTNTTSLPSVAQLNITSYSVQLDRCPAQQRGRFPSLLFHLETAAHLLYSDNNERVSVSPERQLNGKSIAVSHNETSWSEARRKRGRDHRTLRKLCP